MAGMADCECLEGCPFINDKMAGKPATSEMYKKAYCHGSNVQCARFIVFSALGNGSVPSDLFPNQVEKAYDLINATVARSQ
jgi:hypothetical protein